MCLCVCVCVCVCERETGGREREGERGEREKERETVCVKYVCVFFYFHHSSIGCSRGALISETACNTEYVGNSSSRPICFYCVWGGGAEPNEKCACIGIITVY